MADKAFLAIDMGASSGRHVMGLFDGHNLRLEEIYRFENGAVEGGGKMISNFVQGNNEQGVNTVDTGRSPYSDQYDGIESVESPLSTYIIEAGVRKKERW